MRFVGSRVNWEPVEYIKKKKKRNNNWRLGDKCISRKVPMLLDND